MNSSLQLAARRRRTRTRGQAMVEAAIMLSLLSFVWAMMLYTAFMTNNGIQCIAAARHSAWMRGNGLSGPSGAQLDGLFFGKGDMATGLSSMTPNLGSKGSGLLSSKGAIGKVVMLLIRPSDDVRGATVSFGVNSLSTGNPFPFNLVAIDFPLVKENHIEDFLSVQGYCEWEYVVEVFEGADALIAALF